MTLDIEGALKYRGKAVVVQDKKADSHAILVAPIELNGEIDGEWSDEMFTYHSKFLDRNGNTKVVSGGFTKCLPATWYKASNRVTSPDVVLGETVHLYEFGDTRVYFWKEDPRTDFYRRLEHIQWLFSNISDHELDNQPHDIATAYGVTISTRDKYISVKTNKNDGEPYAHEFLIDTKTGKVHYVDDTGIVISAESGVDKILVKNANASFVELNKKDITVSAPTNVNVLAGKDVNVNAGGDINASCTKALVTCKEVELDCKKISSSATLVDFSSAQVKTLSIHAPHAPFVAKP